MTFPFGEPIVLVLRGQPTGQDDFGDETYTPTKTTVYGAFNPGMSSESDNGGTLEQPSVYLPPDAPDLSFLDAIQVRGQEFEVDGAPRVWVNPFTGWQAGTQVLLVAKETG